MSVKSDRYVPPVECAPWCADGDGHPECFCAEDQTCFGTADYVALSLLPVHREAMGTFPQKIGVMPYRDHHGASSVYVHLIDVRTHEDGEFLDMPLQLTADEALQVAAHLVAAANQIEEQR